MARKCWSQEEDALLLELYPTGNNKEIAAAISTAFGTARDVTSVKNRAVRLGLHKADGYVHALPRQFWTPDRVEWFRSFVPGHNWREISEEHERVFGTPLTLSQIKNAKTTLGVHSDTVGGRFKPGHVPSNKGKTWDEFMSPEAQAKSRATCFDKDHRPHNQGELLDERVSQGTVYVKVNPRDAKNPMDYWIAKSRFVWMQANGRDWPDGHVCVFADHDVRNFDPENLVAVPKDLYPIVQGAVNGGMPYFDRESLEVAITAARVIRARTRLQKQLKERRHHE